MDSEDVKQSGSRLRSDQVCPTNVADPRIEQRTKQSIAVAKRIDEMRPSIIEPSILGACVSCRHSLFMYFPLPSSLIRNIVPSSSSVR